MSQVDVVIIGGGLSGTYLAYQLQQRGINYTLLEAKERLGGRILSRSITESSHQVDLGPTWFWPHQQRIQTLLDHLQIPWFEQYVNGDVVYQMDQTSPPQRHSQVGETMISYRVDGGMYALLDSLQDQLSPQNILLSHSVIGLDKMATGWQVTALHDHQELIINADYLVITLPPRLLLQSLSIKHHLPQALVEQLQVTPTWMAAQAKFVASYQSAFWREAGLSGQAFSRVGPLVEVHDASAQANAGFALFGFVGVPALARQSTPEEIMIQYCLKQLADLFGEQALLPQEAYFKDWAKDRYVATDGDLQGLPVHPSLDLKPYDQALHKLSLGFAGTEYTLEEGGYLEGALAAVDRCLLTLGIS